MVTAVDCGVWSPDTTKYVISIIEDLLRQCQSVNDVDDFVDRVGTLVTRVLLKNITIPTETSSITIATAFCRPQTKLNDVSKSKNTASKMYENPHKPFSTDVANGMLRFESMYFTTKHQQKTGQNILKLVSLNKPQTTQVFV